MLLPCSNRGLETGMSVLCGKIWIEGGRGFRDLHMVICLGILARDSGWKGQNLKKISWLKFPN